MISLILVGTEIYITDKNQTGVQFLAISPLIWFCYAKWINFTFKVTIDVAWAPNCVDNRCYDYAALAKVTDFLIVMSYDERSRIYGPCVAGPNSEFSTTFGGKLFIPFITFESFGWLVSGKKYPNQSDRINVISHVKLIVNQVMFQPQLSYLFYDEFYYDDHSFELLF